MNEQIKNYFYDLLRTIPAAVSEVLLIVFIVGAIVIFYLYGWRNGWKKTIWLLLTEYVGLIYCSTVIFRERKEKIGFNYTPFWSYEAIQNGQESLIIENIMNMLVFLPVGIMIGLILLLYKNKISTKMYLKGGGLALAVGLCISVSVEVMQFYLKRGFSEVDDVIHNTLGCFIGFMIVAIIKWIRILSYRKYGINI